MWSVNKEQYKFLVKELAWCALRIKKDTVYYLDSAGQIRKGFIDTERLKDNTVLFGVLNNRVIPVRTITGKAISLKWALMVANDYNSCRSTALSEVKHVCEANKIEFDVPSLAWNRAVTNLFEEMPLSYLIKSINEQADKILLKECGIPQLKGALELISCKRLHGKKGLPADIEFKIKLDRPYTRAEVKPHIKRINTEAMTKLLKHWKFSGHNITMHQYKILSINVNPDSSMNYIVTLKDEYRL